MIRKLFATSFCIATLAACSGDPAELGQGDTAPAWTGTSFDGRELQFPELLEGKPAVVVFWATWCGYCRAFMPYLEAIQSDYAAAGVHVLTINAKEDGSGDPAAYIADLGFPVTAVRNGDAIAAAYDVEYIPGLMIVGADGVVAWRRGWTDLPAGDEVAGLWSLKVRSNLDRLLN